MIHLLFSNSTLIFVNHHVFLTGRVSFHKAVRQDVLSGCHELCQLPVLISDNGAHRSKASDTVIQKVFPALCPHNVTSMCHAVGEKKKISGMLNTLLSHIASFQQHFRKLPNLQTAEQTTQISDDDDDVWAT